MMASSAGIDDRGEVGLRIARLLLFGNVAKVVDDTEAPVGQGDAIQSPFIALDDAAIQTSLGASASRAARRWPGVADNANDFIA
jgi:hypothetical protein